MKKVEKQSVVFEKEKKYNQSIIDILIQIENKEPQTKESFSNILKLLKKYIIIDEKKERNKDDSMKIIHSISVKYEEYLKQQYKKKKFFENIKKIQDHHENNTLTFEILTHIEFNL